MKRIDKHDGCFDNRRVEFYLAPSGAKWQFDPIAECRRELLKMREAAGGFMASETYRRFAQVVEGQILGLDWLVDVGEGKYRGTIC